MRSAEAQSKNIITNMETILNIAIKIANHPKPSAITLIILNHPLPPKNYLEPAATGPKPFISI